jgi:hypothetical protein
MNPRTCSICCVLEKERSSHSATWSSTPNPSDVENIRVFHGKQVDVSSEVSVGVWMSYLFV